MKSARIVISWVVFAFGFSAQAGNFFSRASDLDLRDAVILAFNRSHLKCTTTGGNTVKKMEISSMLIHALHASIEEKDGEASTIQLSGKSKENDNHYLFHVYPSEDLKKIQSLTYSIQRLESVNSGTLLNPSFSEEWSNVITGECH